MKTLLISPLWLDSRHEDSMLRNTKWLDFILPLKDKLGYDEIFLVDNASTPQKVDFIEKKYPITIHRCKTHLSRREHLRYPYWYSALAIASQYALDNDYQKLLYIDTDVFPLTDKMCDYTRNITSGWTCLWCHRHNFPESCYQIVGPDKLEDFREWMSRDFLTFYPDLDAESQLPVTHIEKRFTVDRYGEFDYLPGKPGIPQKPEHDYYAQCPTHVNLVFNMAKK